MRRQTYGYLLRRGTSPPHGWYEIILLSKQRHMCVNNLPKVVTRLQVGVDPETFQSAVWPVSPNSIMPTLRQSPEQVPGKVADLSRTQIIKVRDTNHVANFHDLCPRQVHDFVGNLFRTLSRTLSQTSQHVEMVCVRDFRDLCRRLSPKLHGFMICHRLCPQLSPRFR